METSTVIVSASVVAAKNTRRNTKTSERKTMTDPSCGDYSQHRFVLRNPPSRRDKKNKKIFLPLSASLFRIANYWVFHLFCHKMAVSSSLETAYDLST
jgi:hypothetical protein